MVMKPFTGDKGLILVLATLAVRRGKRKEEMS